MKDEIRMPDRISSGIPGLDQILLGGLPKERVYLVHGGPGAGKTTLGFQFLLEGVRQRERVLYVSLLQTRSELESILGSHGWSLEGIDLVGLPEEVLESSAQEQTLFSTVDVELHEVTDFIVDAIERYKPDRLFFDSLSELAVLVDSAYQLRRHALRLKRQTQKFNCTTLFAVIESVTDDVHSIQTIVNGVIRLGMQESVDGPPRRWLNVTKMRGVNHHGGKHDFRICTGGVEVYPRTEVAVEKTDVGWEKITSGNQELDALFGGGLEEGTACLLSGTTGAGKSTLAALYVEAAAKRGDRSIIFCFDERRQTFLRRTAGIGLEIQKYVDEGLIDLRQINVGDLSPGELAYRIRRAVDEEGVKVVVIDSVTGYLHTLDGQHQLMVQLHELLSYLGNCGVLTLLISARHTLAAQQETQIDASYLADTVVFMRNFESMGAMRHCISVLKKRHGNHEKTIREMKISHAGVELGPPLQEFQGILTGNPRFIGNTGKLLLPKSSE